MTQLELELRPQTPPAFNLVGHVLAVMQSGRWLTPYEIQREILAKTGEWHSDSSLTARLRDARKQLYGGHTIELRKREGTKSYEYRLAD
jgi:hypothetical protein